MQRHSRRAFLHMLSYLLFKQNDYAAKILFIIPCPVVCPCRLR